MVARNTELEIALAEARAAAKDAFTGYNGDAASFTHKGCSVVTITSCQDLAAYCRDVIAEIPAGSHAMTYAVAHRIYGAVRDHGLRWGWDSPGVPWPSSILQVHAAACAFQMSLAKRRIYSRIEMFPS